MGMIVVIFGVLNLMYAFHYRNSIGFYAKKKIKQMHNATEFYKVQFKCYFLSFLILCILGIYMLLANGQDTWILVAPLIMHILTFVSLYSSASKGYIDVQNFVDYLFPYMNGNFIRGEHFQRNLKNFLALDIGREKYKVIENFLAELTKKIKQIYN